MNFVRIKSSITLLFVLGRKYKEKSFQLISTFLYLYKVASCSEGESFGDREEVVGNIGPMGELKGVVKKAKVYPDAPHSARTIYMFRKDPYFSLFELTSIEI